jgi:hypothetical protein
MADERALQRLKVLREVLLVSSGIVLTLLLTVFRQGGESLPFGWIALWVITTFGCVPMGIYLLIGSSWRAVPLGSRRGPAMGYLLVGFANFFSLALNVMYTSEVAPILFVPLVYALGLGAVYLRLFRGEGKAEELFP